MHASYGNRRLVLSAVIKKGMILGRTLPYRACGFRGALQ